VQKYDVGLNEIKIWSKIKQTFQQIGILLYLTTLFVIKFVYYKKYLLHGKKINRKFCALRFLLVSKAPLKITRKKNLV
jgi:hypothetical protein